MLLRTIDRIEIDEVISITSQSLDNHPTLAFNESSFGCNTYFSYMCFLVLQ